jgi:hypothetical protein
MPRENKSEIVVATAPDGEIIAYGTMTRSQAQVLVDEINAHDGWQAVTPIFGSAGMWPSSYEAKSGMKEFRSITRAYKVHVEGAS